MREKASKLSEGLSSLKDAIDGRAAADKGSGTHQIWGTGPFNAPNAVDLDGHIVTITSAKHGNLVLKAWLLEQVNYNINASWSANNDALSKLAAAADAYTNTTFNSGTSVQWAGFATRKYYNGGSQIAMTIKIRLVEHDALNTVSGTSFKYDGKINKFSVPAQMQHLTKLALPTVTASLAATDIISSTTFDKATEAVEGATDNVIEKTDNKVLTFLAGASKNAAAGRVEQIKDSDLTQANNPGTISVNVGGWLRIEEAIITSIQLNPSYQMTHKGPLYCDVLLGIETRENPAVSADGGTNVMKIYATANEAETPPPATDSEANNTTDKDNQEVGAK